MSELARLRLARASRNWFSGSELASSVESYVRLLSERGYASGTVNEYLESVARSLIVPKCARGFRQRFSIFGL